MQYWSSINPVTEHTYQCSMIIISFVYEAYIISILPNFPENNNNSNRNQRFRFFLQLLSQVPKHCFKSSGTVLKLKAHYNKLQINLAIEQVKNRWSTHSSLPQKGQTLLPIRPLLSRLLLVNMLLLDINRKTNFGDYFNFQQKIMRKVSIIHHQFLI